jgi:D-beta-D-heptose 7-phosphate kinase/D-beta-D-heptose 1-phosphate adenosyltransferase
MRELRQALAQLGNPRLLVLGDLMLDGYTHGLVERISPEFPVPILQVERREVRPGGAAGVAVLAHALGAEVSLAGIVGEDWEGQQLRHLLTEVGIEQTAVFCDGERQTTTKERVLAWTNDGRVQPLLRVDNEQRRPLRPILEGQMIRIIRKQLRECDALLISDYAKGVCSPGILERVRELAAWHGIPVLIDPAYGTDYRHYCGASLLTPNRREAERAAGQPIRSDADAVAVGQQLGRDCQAGAVMVKLGGDGLALVEEGRGGRAWPAWTQAVRDVTGAGDMVLAMAGLCRASELSWPETSQLANVAAGLQVQRQGVETVSRAEVEAELLAGQPLRGNKVVTHVELMALATVYRRENRRLVLTNGCFDLLHAGHVRCLEEAARLGDVLVVAVNDDASIRRLKGPTRPVIGQEQRVELVAALSCVDHVLLFDEDTPHTLLRQLRPDVLVKGGTYDAAGVIGREVVEAYGGRVCVTGKAEGVSTTQILAAARRMPCSGRALEGRDAV